MFPDGVCRVKPGYFTKTIQFQDINYQLNQNEDKTAIFEGWCDFLNYFDSSVKFQLSFMNMAANKETYGKSIVIPPQGDDFDGIREEYTEMLRNQLARGNNGLIKTKYLTFGIEAANVKVAKPRLERIETDILNNFKRLGVKAETLEQFGAVSEQTAGEMASGSRKAAGADIGIGITGIAGPEGGTEEKPVGLVYIATCVCGVTTVKEYRFSGNRNKIRENTVVRALIQARKGILDYLQEKE